MESISMC